MARDLGISYTENIPYYFISYNSEDENRVSVCAKALEKLKLPMWYDNGIKIGKAWETEIADRLEHCEAVIMFLSKNIFLKEDSYVHKEFELATEYFNKDIYVIVLDDIKKSDVPNRFKIWWTSITKLQNINAFEYAKPEAFAEKLLESIGFGQHCSNETQDNFSVYLLRKKTGEKMLLNDGINCIGRNIRKCSVFISENLCVSSMHAVINKNGTQMMFQDLNSTNGSFVNGKKVAVNTAISLKQGDIVQLANEEFEVIFL